MANDKAPKGGSREISPEEAAEKRAAILENLQRPPRAGDEQDNAESEPTLSTMILPGD